MDLAKMPALKEVVPPITSTLARLIEGQSPYHAEIVRKLGATVLTGSIAEVREQFCSLDMWGGSGSVADLSLGRAEAQKRSCDLLSQLNRQFRDAGIEFPRADQWTTVFDQWLEEGVFDKLQ